MVLKSLIILSFIAVSSCGIKGPPLPPVPQVQQAPVVEAPPVVTPAPEIKKPVKKKKKTN